MWKLTIVDDEGNRTVLPLSRGEYTVGRAETNTVRLTDRNISRSHLVLRRDGSEAWIVEDLNSYNGCFVNGVRVSGTHPLYHGDLLQLGDYRLEILDEARAGAAESTERPETRRAPSASLLDRPDRLVVVDGPAAGTEFPLDSERVVLGRAEDVDISINHSSVSRVHAEVVRLADGQYEVFDRGSSNGIRVNGVKFQQRVVEDGDEIELGDVRIRYVARGKIFVPGAPPRSHSFLPSSSTSSAPHVAQRKGGLGVMIAAGAALGFIAVVLFVALRPTSSTADDDPKVTAVADQESLLVDEAKRLATAGDLDGAHGKLQQLLEGSTLRDRAEVKDIEARWADATLAKAEREADLTKRRQILALVAGANGVDAERRKRAADLLNALDSDGTNIHDLPTIAKKPPEAVPGPTRELPDNPYGQPAPTKPEAAAPPPPKTAPPSTPEPPPPATTTAGKKPDNVRDTLLEGRDGEERARKMLEPRVWSGKATADEIKMLRAICRHQRDSACVARASEMLRQKNQ